jgi:hypothetical protein
MVTFSSSVARSLVLLGSLLALSACGRILGIEKAHVDPILSDDETNANDDDDELDTVEAPDPEVDSGPDDDDDTSSETSASSDVTNETSDVAGECISFDNRRVRHLNSDGTLTPLPSGDNTATR